MTDIKFCQGAEILRLKASVIMKKAYQAPRVIVHGNIEKVTQGGGFGHYIDKNFPHGTPKSVLTFHDPFS